MAQWKVTFVAFLLGLGLATCSDLAGGLMDDVYMAGRQLQAVPRPCRWNPNFGSCDFNYPYVATLKPTNPAAAAARQWFINAKSCDSAAYQQSRARCEGDNTHFCKWTGSSGSVKCTAILQPFYNYRLACSGSVAKDQFYCQNKFTKANCLSYKGCRWITPATGAATCKAARLTLLQNTYLNSDNLKIFRAAWGVCDGSNVAFNQTLCSKKKSQSACVNAKYCTWGVFGSAGGVCYTSNQYSLLFLYRNDPGFKYLLSACNKPTKATCEAVAAPTSAAKLASLDG